MRYSAPQTVDILAAPLTAAVVVESQIADARSVIRQSIGTDTFLLFISLLMGILCSSAVGLVEASSDLEATMLRPPTWFIYLACAAPSLLVLIFDGLRASSNPLTLPFAQSESRMKMIYAKRIHLGLLAFYFTSILVALCWSAPSMLLFSKMFVAAIFAIALYALGQSIPSRRSSFIVSGILFLVVLVTTQAFIMMRLELDTERAEQRILDSLPSEVEKVPTQPSAPPTAPSSDLDGLP